MQKWLNGAENALKWVLYAYCEHGFEHLHMIFLYLVIVSAYIWNMGTNNEIESIKEYSYIETAIEHYIITFFDALGIPANEIDSQKEQRWSACLASIGSQIFPHKYWLIPPIIHRGANVTNGNILNIYKLIVLAREYIIIANKYNKKITIEDFCALANINKINVYKYKNIQPTLDTITMDSIIDNYINNNGILVNYNDEEFNSLRNYLYKILMDSKQDAFASKLMDTRQGVSLMYLGNNCADLLPQSAGAQGAGFSLEGVADSLQIAQK